MNQAGLISKVLIAEDNVEDYQSIMETIGYAATSEIVVENARTVDELWSLLPSFQPDLIIQDINIPVSDTDSGTGESGLSNLFDIFHVHPNLPVVINSGYVAETHETIIEMLVKKLPLVMVLDKAKYSVSDVELALEKGNEFRRTNGDWYKSQLDNLKKRNSEYKKQLKDAVIVFDDDIDISERAAAEARQTSDGKCPLTFFRACQSFEKLILKLSTGAANSQQLAMGKNINFMAKKFRLPYDLTSDSHKCWGLRNKHVHALASVDTLKNTRFVHRTINFIEDICR